MQKSATLWFIVSLWPTCSLMIKKLQRKCPILDDFSLFNFQALHCHLVVVLVNGFQLHYREY